MSQNDQVYLDEPYLSIRWRGGQQILYAERKGFATSAEFLAALSTGLVAIREHHVVGYVSDARKAKVFAAEDHKWAMTDWAPQAVAAGLQRMAMVTAETGLAKAIVRDVSKQIDQHGLSMRTFDSVGAATVWAQTGLTEPKPK